MSTVDTNRCNGTKPEGQRCGMTTDPAVQAVFEALWERIWPGGHTGEPYSREEEDRATLFGDSEVAVAAARPIIEAEVRERIAAEIEAQEPETYACGDGHAPYGFRSAAARIARGGAS